MDGLLHGTRMDERRRTDKRRTDKWHARSERNNEPVREAVKERTVAAGITRTVAQQGWHGGGRKKLSDRRWTCAWRCDTKISDWRRRSRLKTQQEIGSLAHRQVNQNAMCRILVGCQFFFLKIPPNQLCVTWKKKVKAHAKLWPLDQIWSNGQTSRRRLLRPYT